MTTDLFGGSSRRYPGRSTEIKQWAGEAFRLDEGASVMVAELRCSEPGCPPLETVVALMGTSGPPRQHKIHKPMAEVTPEDLAQLATEAVQSPKTEEHPS